MTCDCVRKFGKETQQETINAYKVLGTLKLGIFINIIILYLSIV
jgi:hypothetical protein